MRGTCIDVTDRILAERERERTVARFTGLVASAPDAILVLDGDGPRARGQHACRTSCSAATPSGTASRSSADRSSREAGAGDRGHRAGRSPAELDVTSSSVSAVADEDLVAAVPARRGAAAGRRGAGRAARRGAAASPPGAGDQRQRRAGAGRRGVRPRRRAVTPGGVYIQRTLAAARAMMDDLLEPLDGEDLGRATWCASARR